MVGSGDVLRLQTRPDSIQNLDIRESHGSVIWSGISTRFKYSRQGMDQIFGTHRVSI